MATYGWYDKKGFNENLFCSIEVVKEQPYGRQVPEEFKNITVVGKIVSTSISNASNWESALEGQGAESSFGTTSALFQSGEMAKLNDGKPTGLEGKTMVSIDQSIQVWRGIEPLTVSITLEFLAFSDANREVELPVHWLYLFQAPLLRDGLATNIKGAISNLYESAKAFTGIGEVPTYSKKETSTFGEIPYLLDISAYGKRFNAMYVLESISEDQDEQKRDRNGRRITQQVSLSFKSTKAISRSDSPSKASIVIKN